MKRTFYTLLFLAASNFTFAQTNTWKYDFGETESTFNPNPGASSTKFLPKGAINLNKGLKQVVRVRTSSDATGAFSLVKKGASFIKGAGLEIVAGSSTSKFSIYNIDSKSIAKTSFNIKFDESSAGQWVFANGNTNIDDDVFQGNSAIKETTAEVFAGLRWTLSPANELGFYTRNGVKWSAVKNHPFIKNGEYLVEIYSNNSAENKSYTKDGANTLKTGTFHVWVNGKRIPIDFVSGGLEVGKDLAGLLIYGTTPKGTETMAKAWVDNLEFSETL